MNVQRVSGRGCVAVSEYWHERIDDGTLMKVSMPQLWGSGAASLINCLIRPYDNINFIFEVVGSADMTIRVLEAPTISGSGTAATPVYLNRYSPAAATLSASFWHTAALTGTGTTLMGKYIPSGIARFGGNSGVGGGEWGFSAGTIYAIQIMSHAIGTYNLAFDYYKE